jgi:hypothetical protein
VDGLRLKRLIPLDKSLKARDRSSKEAISFRRERWNRRRVEGNWEERGKDVFLSSHGMLIFNCNNVPLKL